MNRLVGIPWGHKPPPQEADCTSLMLYAQEIMWGRRIDMSGISIEWEDDKLDEASKRIEIAVPKVFDRVEIPCVGGIATMKTLGYTHVITILDKDLLLHTVINRSSRIVKFRPTQYMTFWKLKEARICHQ